MNLKFDSFASILTRSSARFSGMSLLKARSGGNGSVGLTLTRTVWDALCIPALSMATAVSAYVPAGTLLHVAVYGGAATVPRSMDPA